jgi:hypothetical protein
MYTHCVWYYIYIHIWKAIKTMNFCQYGFWHVSSPLRFFSKYGPCMSGCKRSTYRSIIFLKSWICRTGFDSMSVSSRDSIWGSMLTFAYVFFFNMMLKQILVFYGYIIHPNLVGNMAVFVARFGYPIATPNFLHFGLKFLFWKLS